MKLHLCNLHINIASVGGQYTCIQLPTYKMAIDMGICTPSALRCEKVFFTHAHTDHIAGFIRHCSIREMMNMKAPTYIIGEEHRSAFDQTLGAWRRLNRSFMKCNVKTMRPKDVFSISKTITVEAFRSVHRMPCQGYILYETKKKLKDEYRGLENSEIVALRKQNVDIVDSQKIPLLAYTGDTTIDVLNREPILRTVKILILEVTFFDDDVPPEKARKHGHIHIEDIPKEEGFFENEHLVIMHVSARHSTARAQEIIEDQLPQYLQDKITLIPNSFSSIID